MDAVGCGIAVSDAGLEGALPDTRLIRFPIEKMECHGDGYEPNGGTLCISGCTINMNIPKIRIVKRHPRPHR
jgi:hypothetical protein